MPDQIEIRLGKQEMASIMTMLDLALENTDNVPPWVFWHTEKFMMEMERQAHVSLGWCKNGQCEWGDRVLSFRKIYREYLLQDETLKNRYINGVYEL